MEEPWEIELQEWLALKDGNNNPNWVNKSLRDHIRTQRTAAQRELLLQLNEYILDLIKGREDTVSNENN